MKQRVLSSCIVCSILLLSGCSSVGPDFIAPKEAKLPSTWENNATSVSDVRGWWKNFNDTTLDALVDKASQQNFDLRSAGLRILQARAALGVSDGLLYPQVQTLSGSLASMRKDDRSLTSFTTGFDVGWEMDFWGKYARTIESSEALLYASMASYETIMASVIAEVARNYINYTTAKERMMFAQRNVAIQEKVLHITQIQFNAGNVSELDVQQAKTELYMTKSAIPAYKLQMIYAKNAMAILLGTLPEEIDGMLEIEQNDARDIRAPHYDYSADSYIPVMEIAPDFVVDAALLLRRPDIRVAEYQAKAQNARIGATEAELYPHFTLFGSISYSTHNILGDSNSFKESISVGAGPAFSWNIFQYGRIKNQVRLQDAKFQESLSDYNKKVLVAVGEVSNALDGYRFTKEQLELNALATEATQRAFELSLTQYENGLVTYQRLLNSVEKLTRNEDQYALLKGNISLQAIALYKALGGGWEAAHQREYLSQEDIEQMRERSDWDDYFEMPSQLAEESTAE